MIFDDSLLYSIPTSLQGIRHSLYDLANWKNGRAFKSKDFSASGIPVIKISELNNGIGPTTSYTDSNFSNEVHILKGDLLFSWSGNPLTSIDTFRFSMDEGWLNQHIFKVVPDQKLVDFDYFYYLMKFLKPHFVKMAINKQTTGLGHVTISDIKRINVIIPSRKIQRYIVSVLKPIDEKININQKINHHLEEMALTLFENEFSNVAVGGHYVGEYIRPKRGKGLLSKNAVPGEIPVIAGGLKPATYHNVANTDAPVITISASGANAGFVKLWNVPVWSSDSSFIDSSMTKNIYFWYVMLKKRQQEIYDSQTGSAQPHIYPKHIENLSTMILNNTKLESYNNQVTPLFEEISANLKENQSLKIMRDSLLLKLMSGKIIPND